ncbi:MAG: hypothetical protein AB1603_05280 [Chloroflexota bacterium]
MRRLLYIPIIHDQADLGSEGAALSQGSVVLAGQRRWTSHQELVARFWDSLASYLGELEPGRVKVYQDGLAAGGQMGRRVVEEAARRGSKNYQLVLELLDKGAEIRKTEDPGLLLQEQQNIQESVARKSEWEERHSAEQYRLRTGRLMAARDRFIAGSINTTLREGEVGVLFIGAGHNVAPHLSSDIQVETVRDRKKVQAYLEELFLGQDDRKLEELRRYLSSPPSAPALPDAQATE